MSKKKRFDHAISFNFTLKTDNEEPTGKEIMGALSRAISGLDEDSISDAVEIFDSHDYEGDN